MLTRGNKQHRDSLYLARPWVGVPDCGGKRLRGSIEEQLRPTRDAVNDFQGVREWLEWLAMAGGGRDPAADGRGWPPIWEREPGFGLGWVRTHSGQLVSVRQVLILGVHGGLR